MSMTFNSPPVESYDAVDILELSGPLRKTSLNRKKRISCRSSGMPHELILVNKYSSETDNVFELFPEYPESVPKSLDTGSVRSILNVLVIRMIFRSYFHQLLKK
jgi:hypothetical protein